jgi:hypothetical protein
MVKKVNYWLQNNAPASAERTLAERDLQRAVQMGNAAIRAAARGAPGPGARAIANKETHARKAQRGSVRADGATSLVS